MPYQHHRERAVYRRLIVFKGARRDNFRLAITTKQTHGLQVEFSPLDQTVSRGCLGATAVVRDSRRQHRSEIQLFPTRKIARRDLLLDFAGNRANCVVLSYLKRRSVGKKSKGRVLDEKKRRVETGIVGPESNLIYSRHAINTCDSTTKKRKQYSARL